MAEELQVVVQQEVGTICWNFDELKTALAAKMQDYENLVYTAESIPAAKSDVAMLRKLKKTVEDRRKEIKAKCLEPYAAIEAQAKELGDLIDKPIAQIDEQIKTYEAARRMEVRQEIERYMDEAYASMPTAIADKLKYKIYDPRWENATADKREWRKAIEESAARTYSDLDVLSDVDAEFREKAIAVYVLDLSLADAMARANELRRVKEEVLEQERLRREAEDRARVEEAEKKQREAEQAAQDAQNAAQTRTDDGQTNDTPKTENANPAASRGSESAESAKKDEIHTICFRVTASRETLNKIYAFIKESGAEFKWREEANV